MNDVKYTNVHAPLPEGVRAFVVVVDTPQGRYYSMGNGGGAYDRKQAFRFSTGYETPSYATSAENWAKAHARIFNHIDYRHLKAKVIRLVAKR